MAQQNTDEVQQTLKTMRDGDLFFLHQKGGPKQIRLILDEKEHILYWSDPYSNQRSANQSFILDSSQLQIKTGKQTPYLKLTGPEVDKQCCFAIVTQDGRSSLELQAISKKIADTWFVGISLFGFGEGNTPVTMAERPKNLQDVHVDKNNKTVQLLQQGNYFHNFVLDEQFPERTSIFVWLDPNEGSLGCLYWQKASSMNQGRQKNKDDKLRLSSVTDMYSGRSPPKNVPTTDAPDASCFSITSKTTTLYLEAENTDIRSFWVFGLHGIMSGAATKKNKLPKKSKSEKKERAVEKRVEVMPEPVRMPEPVYVPEPQPVQQVQQVQQPPTPAPVLIMPDAPKTTLDYLREGTRFYAYLGSPVGVTKRTIFLFLDESVPGGTLFWNFEGTYHRDSAMCIPIRDITHLFPGKTNAVLNSAVAAQADPDMCLCFVTRNNEFNIEAFDVHTMGIWIEGVKMLLQGVGKLVQVLPEGGNTGLKEITVGRMFTAWKDPHDPISANIHIFFDKDPDATFPGYLFWCEQRTAADRPMDPSRCMDLNTFTGIFVGRYSSLWQHPKCAAIPDDCCLSLVGRTEEEIWNIQAQNSVILNIWVTALIQRLRESGKIVDSRDGGKVNSIMSLNEDSSFQSGTFFNIHTGGPSAPSSRTIRLFYYPQEFSLFWSEPHPAPRVAHPTCQISLLSLREISFGKCERTALLTPMCHSIPDNVFFSLISEDVSLDLQANASADIIAWKEFLSRTLYAADCILQPLGTHRIGITSLEDLERDKVHRIQLAEQELAIERQRMKEQQQAALKALEEARVEQKKAEELSNLSAQYAQTLKAEFIRKLQSEQESQQREAALPTNEVFARTLQGHGVFDRYFTSPKGEVLRQQVYLTYTIPSHLKQKGQPHPLGALSWSGVSDSAAFLLGTCTDIFTGKNRDAFHRDAGLQAAEDCCLSFCSADNFSDAGVQVDLHVEAPSMNQAVEFLGSVVNVMKLHGREVVEVESVNQQFVRIDPETTQRRNKDRSIINRHFRVLNKGQTINDGNTLLTMAMYMRSSSAFQRDILKMMKDGRIFAGYTVKRGKVIRRPIRVWYEVTNWDTTLGSLYWCPSTTNKQPSLDTRLPLSEIKMVQFGRQDRAFHYLDPNQAPTDDRCFSIISTQATLSFEADATEHLVAWMYGLNTLLCTLGGKKGRPTADHTYIWY